MTKEIKINSKYSVGLPFISDAYKSRTPKKLKNVGETLVFIGGAVAIVAGTLSPPGWVIMAGGLATLAGRFVIKCFAEKK